MIRRIILWPALATIVCAQILSAQSSQKVALEGSLVFVSLSGDILSEASAGPGLDAAAVFGLNDNWSLGAGLLFSRHHVNELDADASALQLYAEPRFLLRTTSEKFHPYILARVGYVRASGSATGVYGFVCQPPATGDRSCSALRTGWSAGIGAGAEYKAGGNLSYQGSISLHSVHLGQFSSDDGSLGDPTSGTAILLRAGVRLALKQ